jgi:competence protein ComEC
VREEDKRLFEKYFEVDDRYSQPISSDDDPDLPANNGGVEILNFHPKKCTTSNINNHSIVTVISYAESKIIIPGDNEPPSWKELLEDDTFKTAIKGTDIMVAPHHGRESGYCADLFEHFIPKLTVISDHYETESSATDKYTKISSGWTIHHRDRSASEKRYCITTRTDGVMNIEMGYLDDKRPYLYVTVS